VTRKTTTLDRRSRQFDGIEMRAEFHHDTGRLRIFEDAAIRAERFPPQSWMAIVSVTGYSTCGRCPNERDLVLVLSNFRSNRVGHS
jgi:hypothetical protein